VKETGVPTLDEWMRFYSSPNPRVRLRAANAILARAGEVPLDVLVDILQSLAWQGLGAKAEKALLKRNDQELVPRIIDLLKSNDDFVREVACNVLGHSGNFSATRHLIRMIDDPKMMVRRAAGFGLAFLKDVSSVPALKQALDQHSDDDTNVVSALQCALTSCGERPE
jgi:HEAT repeat protein